MAVKRVLRWVTIPVLVIFLQNICSSSSIKMTYGLVYRHPSFQAPKVPAEESTILSTTILAPLESTEQVVANESKIVPQIQYEHKVINNPKNNISNFNHRIGSTTNTYGIRSRYGQLNTLSDAPFISQLSSAFAPVKQSATTTRLSILAPSITGLDHKHRYEVVENGVEAEKKVLRENQNSDTDAEGSEHRGKKAKSGKKGSKLSHKHYAKHGKKQKKGHKGHHFKDYKNKKKGAHESSGHKSHKHASKKKSHKSQGKKGGEHHKKAHKMKKKKFKKQGAKKKHFKKKGFKDKYKVDKEDKIHKFWNNHHETGEFYEFNKKDKYHHETKKGEKKGKHKQVEKKSKKKKKEGVKKSKKGEKKEHGHKAHKNKKKFYHDEHEYAKKKKDSKKEQHKQKKSASKKGGHKKKKKKH